MPNVTTYDAENRLISEGIDHGDGTGTLTTFDPESGEQVASVPWEPPPPIVSQAQAAADLADAAAQAAAEELPADSPLRAAIEALAAAL